MALKNNFKTKHGIELADAYLKLEFTQFAATHHKKRGVMIAHYQVFASEQARREGLDFIDVIDIEVPMKDDLESYVYGETKKLVEFTDSVDIIE